MAEGHCRWEDPDLMFPLNNSGYTNARMVCDGCPVKTTCLDYALDNMADTYDVGMNGMWGGTTPPDRLRILLSRGFAPLKVAA